LKEHTQQLLLFIHYFQEFRIEMPEQRVAMAQGAEPRLAQALTRCVRMYSGRLYFDIPFVASRVLFSAMFIVYNKIFGKKGWIPAI
jgi:hypothetical protein